MTENSHNANNEYKLFFGNLAYSVTDQDLRQAVSGIEGIEIVEAIVVVDKFNNNRSRGFGFVKVAEESMMQKVVDALNGKEINGRAVTVNVARPKSENSHRH